jgi:N utilization substance protein A
MARRATDDEEQRFNGRIDLKALEQVAQENFCKDGDLTMEQIDKIIVDAIDKAGRETLYPEQKKILVQGAAEPITNAEAMHTETTIDPKTGEIFFYECKDVVDDVEDDLYQIETDEAQEIDPNLKAGDVYKRRVDLTTIDYSFFVRANQKITEGLRKAAKQALIDRYSDRKGKIISGTVEKVDGNYIILNINNLIATLTPMNSIPGEKFVLGDTVKVLLKDIGTGDDMSASGAEVRGASLIISRSDDNFLRCLFEQEIPDIADGSVVINGIVREPGNRAKVAVSSPLPDVDPTGACIGSDGSRIKDICAQVANEKIDVIKYQDNPYLYIAEALKPATVVGVIFKDEPAEEGKAPKAIAVVKNEESKIAIGKKGVNVRLASKLTGYSIDIKEQDAAMSEHLSYVNIDDIRRKLALERLDQEETAGQQPAADENAVSEEEMANNENEQPEEETQAAEINEVKPEQTPAPAVTAAPEAPQASEAAPVAVPAPAVEAAPAPVSQPEAAPAPAEQPKPVEKPVEHVEINTSSKAKISLDRLEAEIEAEKKKGKQTRPSYYKPHFDKSKEEDKSKATPVVANAMPIYTADELKQMEEEEKNSQETTTQQPEGNSEEYEEYDSDQYYDEDQGKK